MEVDTLHGVTRAVVAQLRRTVGERIVPVADVAEVMDLHALSMGQCGVASHINTSSRRSGAADQTILA